MRFTSLPRLESYLARLPRGLDSYPTAQAKASLISNAVEVRRPLYAPDALPPELVELIERPPPVSTWIPEVQMHAVMLALADLHFPGDDEAYITWVAQLSRRLYAKPLYRVLMHVLSPARLLEGATTRWGAFHRGTNAEILESSPRGARVTLGYPAHTYNELQARSIGASLLAAVEAAGGKRVVWTLESFTRERAILSGTWI